jgi:hypothetical protein
MFTLHEALLSVARDNSLQEAGKLTAAAVCGSTDQNQDVEHDAMSTTNQ